MSVRIPDSAIGPKSPTDKRMNRKELPQIAASNNKSITSTRRMKFTGLLKESLSNTLRSATINE
jgi:hypothetical protein